jgi:two-component system sensor histidine kinase KdpD
MPTYRRKTPEELLLSLYELQRGRLKIYIGPVSGSGKTYQMLREGQALKQDGIDVILCAVSTNQRPDTMEQLEGLERIASIHWQDKHGREWKDLDLDAILSRNPEVLLTDNLAHKNREGAPYPDRFADIKHLLSRGISVITTVNGYELEGAAELARDWAGIEVAHSLPQEALVLADEICLNDVTPETVLARLSAGQLGRTELTAKQRLDRRSIAKLRELALRLVAEDVNTSLEKHRETLGLQGAAGIAEKVLVSAQYHWNGSIYVRRGQQIARRLNGDLAVVTFVQQGEKLPRETAVFKRSLVKLADKIGAAFEEVPVRSTRQIPRLLVDYAISHNVTRIVMGHSRQTLLEDLRKGSLAAYLLRHIRGVDLFFVADRSEQEGERILPTRQQRAPRGANTYHRLSEQEVEDQIQAIKRGTFKVYIGAAPGVGKTYKMLREGNDLLHKGIDVVIGLLETHGRKETQEQTGGLAAIDRRICEYRGARLQEMDTAAIIRRNPEVVLVDELAHTNVPGSKNDKRYKDVMELLAAGISVISTLNIQHLESLNDAVEKLTGVRVRETVPDHVLQLADEVLLIDVSPKALRERLREGKIYALSKVDQALNHFFRLGNLIALRELALRELADDVDERLEGWERDGSLRGPWRRKEVICVFVPLTDNAERLIRRGFRIAYRLKATWHVLYVRDGGKPLSASEEKRLAALRNLTERLQGSFVLLAGTPKHAAAVLVEQAQTLAATQIIMGQSQRSWLGKWLYGDLTGQALRLSRDRDVLVVADYAEQETSGIIRE